MYEELLKEIGLNDKEVKVYLACLRLGPAPVRKVAVETEINRGTTYDILKSLNRLGLVAYVHKEKHQYFMAEDPQKINDYLNDRLRSMEKIKREISQIIPELRSIYDKAGDKPVAKFYEGHNGIKLILNDILESTRKESKEYYAYSSSAIKPFVYKAFKNFTAARIKAGVKVKVISIGPGGETHGLDERKWLSVKKSAPTYTFIYAGKVAMISIDKNNLPMGILIEDKNIYITQKMIFEIMWKKLK